MSTHRWVADEHSARDAARAFLGPVLSRPRVWVLAVLLELALAVMIGDSVGSFGIGLLVALVPTLLVIGGMLGTSYLRTRRTFGARFAPGPCRALGKERHFRSRRRRDFETIRRRRSRLRKERRGAR